MYTSRTGLILGFHGTDQAIVDKVLSGKEDLQKQANKYDWLGHGIYFWDNSPSRALQWAVDLSNRNKSAIQNPAVIGAMIDLGHCLDLLDYRKLALVKMGYHSLDAILSSSGTQMPQNTESDDDLLFRELDCAVIQALHNSMVESGKEFDSVRGVFWEGKEIYPNAGFREKNHIQICVRNIECIKGYFLPLTRIKN